MNALKEYEVKHFVQDFTTVNPLSWNDALEILHEGLTLRESAF